MKHRGWIAFSGLMWLAIGAFLLYKGLHLISEATRTADSLCLRWSLFFGTAQQAGTAFIAAALLAGFFKARFVLSKTVHRVAMRIRALSLPIRIFEVYPSSYWAIIGSMMALGLSLRFFPIPLDIHGFIDVAVGSALLNGATLYFRLAKQ